MVQPTTYGVLYVTCCVRSPTDSLSHLRRDRSDPMFATGETRPARTRWRSPQGRSLAVTRPGSQSSDRRLSATVRPHLMRFDWLMSQAAKVRRTANGKRKSSGGELVADSRASRGQLARPARNECRTNLWSSNWEFRYPPGPDTTPDVRRLGVDSCGYSRKVAEIAVTPFVSDGYCQARFPSRYDPMEPTPLSS